MIPRCPKGLHEMTPENHYPSSPQCKACQRERLRSWRERHPLEFRAQQRRGQERKRGGRPRKWTWHSDDVGYLAVHWRARRDLPEVCAQCGSTSRLHVALRKGVPGEFLRRDPRPNGRTTPLYSVRGTDDYMRLCEPCHKVYDGQMSPERAAEWRERLRAAS